MNDVKQHSKKLRIATTSLAGCFGCHMSLLDIDERLFDLFELVQFDRSPPVSYTHLTLPTTPYV